MKNFSKTAKEIRDSIKNSKNVLLHCHPSPDPDSIGSVLAMKKYLVSIGKNVTAIIGDSDYPSSMIENFPIEKEIEKKSFSDVNLEDFDLFIILDSSSTTQISRKGEVVFPKHLKTIVIDHHKTNIGFGDINFVDEHSASTTQVLYKLFKEWSVEIDKDLALYLFIGIYGDTGGFQYTLTSPETFRIATELVSVCPNYHRAVFNLENNKREIEIEMMGLALSNIKKCFNGKVVLTVIPYQIIKERNISKEDATEGLVPEILRSVKGWDIVGSLVETREGVTAVSLRTRDEKKYDVGMIAKNVGIGGGGHAAAAGTTVMKDAYGAEKELVEFIERMYL
jgi:phosphoesterase RecJ-like protein